jgi:hypothetical protein
MAWVWRAESTLVVCLLACAPFAGCSGDAFTAGGAAGAGASTGATANTAGQQSGSGSGTGASESGGSEAGGSEIGGSESGGLGGVAPLGGRAGMSNGGSGGTIPPIGGTAGSGPLPPVIPTDGLALWFKSDVGVKVEGGVVVEWTDQSANHYKAKPDDPAEAPKLASSSGVPMPVVLFDGEDDHLHLPTVKLEFSQGLSIFAVAGRSQASECAGIVELTTGDPEMDDISLDSVNDSYQFEVVGDTIFADTDAFPQDQLRLLEVTLAPAPAPDKGLSELFVNGRSSGGGKVQTPLAVERSNNSIGDSAYTTCYPFPGGIAEIILYNRKLFADDRAAVEAYLQEKWQCCK